MGDLIKGPADYLVVGDWNVRCSLCGAKEKASKMVKNWQGLWRHPQGSKNDCNEPRQPQDFVRGVQDIQTPPWVQPDEDIDVSVCTYNGCSAIPGWSVTGCMVPGRVETFPIWGLFGFNFTSNVAGQSSGTLTEPITFLVGTYKTTFSDNEVRNVTYNGIGATWSPPLNATAGLMINSCYTNIGTY
jgi:hypothetical protein